MKILKRKKIQIKYRLSNYMFIDYLKCLTFVKYKKISRKISVVFVYKLNAKTLRTFRFNLDTIIVVVFYTSKKE